MLSDLTRVPLIARREIEARLASPLLRAFAPLVGEAPARQALQQVIAEQARLAGAQMAAKQGDNSLASMDTIVEMWGYDGSLSVQVLHRSDTRYDFNVTRCAYAEMYKALDLVDLGLVLSCGRDHPFFEGFNPGIRLARTYTILEGADHCDFRFSLAAPGGQTKP